MSYRILILEDNKLLAETVEDFLSEQDCEVYIADNVDEANSLCFNKKFDLMLLDVKLSHSSGFAFLKSLRQSKDYTPAIFLTSLNDKHSILEGFQIGADDYIKKPFDIDELWLRISAVIQRTKGTGEELLSIDEDYVMDVKRKMLNFKGKSLDLHQKDYDLLELLIKNRNKIVTQEMIQEHLWSPQEEPKNASIRVYINNLKKIFGKDSISNIRGIGYRFEK